MFSSLDAFGTGHSTGRELRLLHTRKERRKTKPFLVPEEKTLNHILFPLLLKNLACILKMEELFLSFFLPSFKKCCTGLSPPF